MCTVTDTVKPVRNSHSQKDRNLVFKTDYRRSKVLQNAPGEHSAILLTYTKLPFVIKTLVLSIYKWPFYTGFTVIAKMVNYCMELV